MTERLTTLAQVKDYLGIAADSTESDSFLTRLIDAASQFALTWISRDSFGVRTYTQNFRGNGKSNILLPSWPAVSITSVGIGGSFVPASAIGSAGLPGSGYVLADIRFGPQSLDLYGYSFWGGAPSQVIYEAGFRTSQTSVIPATPFQITPTTDGQWIADFKVTIDGTDAVKVAATPGAGEYSVDEWGTYTFNDTDATKTAVITYDYAPFDVSFAVTELIGEWYKRKDRIGLLSKTLGGQETVTFSQKDMGESIRCTLQPYANVVPF
jgi:hypothetical protein